MMDMEGNFVGQICHIEAAETGGERFNPNQTNEERRAFSNLLLLCYDHHVITNDVKVYTVEALQNMKSDHESKFADIISKLQNSISDLTQLQEYTYTTDCRKMVDHFGWGYNDEEARLTASEINEWVDLLRLLPPDTRRVFTIMVERSTPATRGSRVLMHEIEKVTGDPYVIKEHYDLLSKYGFITTAEQDYDLNAVVVYIRKFDSGWDFWMELRNYCKSKGLPLAMFIEDMNFSELD
jgi:hypothetical protein